jgi:hypothetical protein
MGFGHMAALQAPKDANYSVADALELCLERSADVQPVQNFILFRSGFVDILLGGSARLRHRQLGGGSRLRCGSETVASKFDIDIPSKQSGKLAVLSLGGSTQTFM